MIEFKNKLFQKVAFELGTKHKLLSPHHPHSSSIFETFHSFLKAYVCKHLHGKLDWEDTLHFLLLILECS